MGEERKEKEEGRGRRKAYTRYFENRERVVNIDSGRQHKETMVLITPEYYQKQKAIPQQGGSLGSTPSMSPQVICRQKCFSGRL